MKRTQKSGGSSALKKVKVAKGEKVAKVANGKDRSVAAAAKADASKVAAAEPHFTTEDAKATSENGEDNENTTDEQPPLEDHGAPTGEETAVDAGGAESPNEIKDGEGADGDSGGEDGQDGGDSDSDVGSDDGAEDIEMEGLDDDDDDDDDDGHDADDTHGGKTKLGSAMARILSQSDGRVVQRPILAKHKSIEHQLDEEKLELRARKALAAERKKRDDLARVFPQIAANDFEKRLRKVATRGVVKLFNAIRTTQKSVDVVKQDGVQKNASKVTGVAKGSFLQMIRESGEKANPSGVDSQSKAKVGESGGPTNGGEATAAAAVKGSGGKSGTASEGVAWTRDDYLNEEATALQKKSGAWDLDSD